MSERVDVVIVGAGPAGLAAGAQAARQGVSHRVLDSARLANTVQRYQRGKLVMEEPSALPLHPELPLAFRAGSREHVLETWEAGTLAAGTELRAGPGFEVIGIEGGAGEFRVRLRGGDEIAAVRVVLAIGLQGNLRRFGVPGEDHPHVTYQLDDPAEHEGARIVVSGAGDASIENALALLEHDNEVTLVNRRDDFARAKEANRKLVQRAIESGRLGYYPNTQVDHFDPGAIVLRTPEGEVRLEVERVIGRLGATPPRDFLEGIGIHFHSRDASAVPQVSESYESNVPGIHVIGALAGYPLIKQCLNQGYEVVEYILGNPVTPADEPLLREKFRGLPGSVSEVLERIRQTLPVFRNLTTIQLREFLIDSVVHRPEPGAVVFQRNEFSDSFYSVLEGAVRVVVPRSDRDRELDRRGQGETVEVRLARGVFFGEMSLISGRRRNADVFAAEDCVLVETPRLAMTRLIHSSDDVRAALDRAFVMRSLANMAPGSSEASRGALADRAELRTFRQGEALWSEGDAFDGIYLLRRGSITISRMHAGGETVVNYVQAGAFVGEAGAVDPRGRRSGTVRAAVHAEAVRLPAEAVRSFLESEPVVRAAFERAALDKVRTDIDRTVDHRASDLITFLNNAGAGEATDLLLIDESLCVQCDNCERACAETHGGVSRLDRKAGPIFAHIKVPTSCRHCENPKCMTDCPPDAIRRHPSGEVYILDNCIGCSNCAVNCPYDVIQMAEVRPPGRSSLWLDLLLGAREAADGGGGHGAEKKAVKCDLCRELPIGQGEVRSSACVAACPTGAVIRVDPKRYVEQLLAGDE